MRNHLSPRWFVRLLVLSGLTLLTVSCAWSGETDRERSWKRLTIPDGTDWFHVSRVDHQPVNMAHYRDDQYFVAGYNSLRLCHLGSGATTALNAPRGVPLWNPTGVAYHAPTRRLWVANYTGHDILALQVSDDLQLTLVHRYTADGMVSPEGIAVTRDGRRLAIGDYDGNSLFKMDSDGNVLWRKRVGLAHGVCFSEDERSIVVTSLYDRVITMFDSERGQRVCSSGSMGWKKDQYLWPTCVTALPGNRFAVGDAHTGYISVLDERLREVYSIGGNGPGMDLFNMPYHILYRGDGRLMIGDAYKCRLVLVDLERNAILRSLNFVAGMRQPPTKSRVTDRFEPLGRGYQQYVSQAAPIDVQHYVPQIPFGRWMPGYGKFSSHGYHLTLQGPARVVGFNSYYFVQTYRWSHNGGDYLLISCPQGHTWLVLHDGLFVTIQAGFNGWIQGDQFVNDYMSVSIQELVQPVLWRFDQWRQSTETEPFERLRATLLGNCTREVFAEVRSEFFVSAAGKQLHKELQQGVPDYPAYYRNVVRKPLIPLLEVCAVNAIRRATTNITTRAPSLPAKIERAGDVSETLAP